MDVEFDLLGDPIPPGFGRRGRPQHVPTDEKRRIVMMLLAFGKSNADIAAALGVTEPTLRKHYFRELKVRLDARHRVEAELFARLLSEVRSGNVSAMALMFKRFDRHDLAVMAPVRKKEPKLGKKETAVRDAFGAHQDTSWSGLLKH